MNYDTTIRCVRGSQSATFGYDWPFWLDDYDGFGAEYDNDTTPLAGHDGSARGNSRQPERVMTLTVSVKENHLANKDRLYDLFRKGEEGTLYFTSEGQTRKINYLPDKIVPVSQDGLTVFTIVLRATDPKFYDEIDLRLDMALWQKMIEFPLELDEWLEVEIMNSTLVASMDNTWGNPSGLRIIFTATGEVVNPGLAEIMRRQSFKLDITLEAGDVLVVDTNVGHKGVTLTRGGVSTDASRSWVFGHNWLQAEPGTNVFRYSADEGIDNLSCSIIIGRAHGGT